MALAVTKLDVKAVMSVAFAAAAVVTVVMFTPFVVISEALLVADAVTVVISDAFVVILAMLLFTIAVRLVKAVADAAS